MRVVLDTNVLVSALLTAGGVPARILALALRGRLTLLYDDRMLAEYRGVLSRPTFGFPAEAVDGLLRAVEELGEEVAAEPQSLRCSDEDDEPFYEVAATGRASGLVTGNTSHFPRAGFVMTPRQFLEHYRARRSTRHP